MICFQFPCRFPLLRICLLLACWTNTQAQAAEQQIKPELKQPDRKPNIVLIMADDFGYECLGCNGGLSYQTPNLDRLAKGGIRFANCHSQPLCTPTRNQIMTGKYNFRNYENFEYLAPTEKTFGHLLQAAGYKTCIAGKWQLNGRGWQREGRKDSARPQKAGFDESCLWQVTDLLKRFKNPSLEVNGKLQTFEGKYGPDVCVDHICNFVESHKDQPMFIYYPMILTHSPFVPTPDSEDWSASKFKRSKQAYFAEMVEYTDKLVARIESCLKKNGLYENTMIIFTGDNGTTRGLITQTKTGPVPGGKGMTIDSGTHVPLIVHWPLGAVQGKTCDDLIDFTDILPTLVEAGGAKLGDDFLSDGFSFLPQIKGKTGVPRKSIYCFYDPVHSNNVNRYRNRFARNKQFKVYRDGTVFDVRRDPLEQRPLERSKLNANEMLQVKYLVKELDKYDSQGAAQAAKALAEKVRPKAPRKKR